MKNSLTVIVMTFNRVTLFKKAIHSCLQQTSKEYSLIIIDNCSIDGTVEFIKSLSFNTGNTKIIFNDANIGAVNSLMKALLLVETEWVTILCDDDFLELNFVEEINKLIAYTSFSANSDT